MHFRISNRKRYRRIVRYMYMSCTYLASPEAGSPSYLIIITPSKLHSVNTLRAGHTLRWWSRYIDLAASNFTRARRDLVQSPLIVTSRSSRYFVLRGRGKRRAYRRRTDADRPAIGTSFVQEISRAFTPTSPQEIL